MLHVPGPRALLFPLLGHPRTAAAEGLSVSTVLGQLLPVPGGRSGSKGGSGAAKQRLLPGYTYLGSATGIDTNGYSVEEGSQATSRPWRGRAARKRAFGVNAVVSHVAWREKERPTKQQSSPAANAVRGLRGRSDDLLCGTAVRCQHGQPLLVQGVSAMRRRLMSSEHRQHSWLFRSLALRASRVGRAAQETHPECPYSNVTGLLVDVVKACAQHSSRGGGAEGCVSHQTVSASRPANEAQLAGQSQREAVPPDFEGALPSFLPQMSELVALEGEEQKDGGGQPTSGSWEKSLLPRVENPPFWSPSGCPPWRPRPCRCSRRVLGRSGARTGRHCRLRGTFDDTVQRLQASKRALGAEVAARGSAARK